MSVAGRLGSGFAALLTAAAVLLAQTHPAAAALSRKECSAQYQTAKSAGTLHGQSYKAFRAAECGSAAAKPAAAPAATATASAGSAVFPSAISPKYSKETPGKARMHTCLDQYKANKASNANGGLKWIQKGGGYYKLCNARLKH
ncbi:MAG: hypothetical protein ACREE2_21500 [Stellaceae bacterium]